MHELAIEHLKSGLSINTHFGCPLGCKYCVLSAIEGHKGNVQKCGEFDYLNVKEYLDKHYYVFNRTPIYVNNRTDPFLSDVINGTYEILDILCELNIQSPIMLITKLKPNLKIEKYFDKLNIMFFYTYSGLPSGVDYNSNSIVHHTNMDAILKHTPKKNRFLYLRPIIPEMNDDLEVLKQVINDIGIYFDTIVMGGIRIIEDNRALIEMLCGKKIEELDYQHKIFDKKIFKSLIEGQWNNEVNIVRHTSCAIANFLSQKNKLDYYEREEHCNCKCRNYEKCHAFESDDIKLEEEINNFLYAYGYLHNKFLGGREIRIAGSVSQELISAIKCAYGYNISADAIELCPSEKKFVKKIIIFIILYMTLFLERK